MFSVATIDVHCKYVFLDQFNRTESTDTPPNAPINAEIEIFSNINDCKYAYTFYYKDGLRTPRIDEVLQKYKEPYSVTKEPAAAATQNDHTSNNVCDDRLLVIEKQLAELLEKNQNMKNHNVKVYKNL